MVAKSIVRGHAVEFVDGNWVFSDTKEIVKERYTPDLAGSGQYLKCASCGLWPTAEGYDGCLGVLPIETVMNACCGHGMDVQAYIQYWDGTIVRGKKAKDEQARLMAQSPPRADCTEREAVDWYKASKYHRLVQNPRRAAKLRKRGEQLKYNPWLLGWLWVMKQ